MNKGERYAFKDDDGRYKKVEYYRDSEELNFDTKGTIFTVQYVIHSPADERFNRGSAKLEHFYNNSRLLSRDTHCWKCKHLIDEITNDICHICGGIICPKDHICMCGYVK
ncbi:hypothetical protein ACFWDG_17750 [Peribacillus sp. NPDC060186]